jgi:hypothetical protein
MEEDFEVFNRYRSRSTKTPLVTIQRGGTISLNWAAFQALDKPKSVELSYSRSKRIIRLRKAIPSDLRTIPVNKQGTSDSFTIGGLTFTKDNDIDISVARRYTGKLEGNYLLIDLNEPSIDATGPRARNYKPVNGQGKQERRMVQRIAARIEKTNSGAEESKVSDREIEEILLKAKNLLHNSGSESKKVEILEEIKRLGDLLNHQS